MPTLKVNPMLHNLFVTEAGLCTQSLRQAASSMGRNWIIGPSGVPPASRGTINSAGSVVHATGYGGRTTVGQRGHRQSRDHPQGRTAPHIFKKHGPRNYRRTNGHAGFTKLRLPISNGLTGITMATNKGGGSIEMGAIAIRNILGQGLRRRAVKAGSILIVSEGQSSSRFHWASAKTTPFCRITGCEVRTRPGRKKSASTPRLDL